MTLRSLLILHPVLFLQGEKSDGLIVDNDKILLKVLPYRLLQNGKVTIEIIFCFTVWIISSKDPYLSLFLLAYFLFASNISAISCFAAISDILICCLFVDEDPTSCPAFVHSRNDGIGAGVVPFSAASTLSSVLLG